MDPSEIRKRLGLPEDATDEQVQETLRELNEASVSLATPNAVTEEGTTAVGTNSAEERKVVNASEGEASAQEGKQEEPTSVAASAAAPDEGTIKLDRETFEQLKAGAQAGLTLKTEMDKKSREDLVAAAISDGRIPPSRRDHWLKNLEADFEGFSETLAGLEKGLIPVSEKGSNETAETAAALGDAKIVQGWTDTLYPEVAARRARVAAMASGQQPLPQIMREEGL
jgi:hypothetical protein